MNTTAIIAEYNPFHLGHAYQIKKIHEVTDTDGIIALMSGNFVQRGIPAIYDKYKRCEMALKNGVDLVLELPVVYATGSAEYFAGNAVSLLNNLNCVNNLVFGMEHDNTTDFYALAGLLLNETSEFKNLIKEQLNLGSSIPVAISTASRKILGENIPDISLSNNILALEYIKAILRLDSSIVPLGIKRIGHGYLDKTATGEYPSATAIRECIYKGDFHILDETYFHSKAVHPDSLSNLLYYSLLSKKDSLTNYLDCGEKLANRIINLLSSGKILNFNEFAMELKAKNYTHTRICRTLLHILLDIKTTDILTPQYVRVLGFNNTGRKILKNMSMNSDIPVIKNIAKDRGLLSDKGYRMLKKDIFATNIYRLISPDKEITDDYRHKPVFLDSSIT